MIFSENRCPLFRIMLQSFRLPQAWPPPSPQKETGAAYFVDGRQPSGSTAMQRSQLVLASPLRGKMGHLSTVAPSVRFVPLADVPPDHEALAKSSVDVGLIGG